MTEFTITEDFPEQQKEFDERFSSEEACRLYLFSLRWPDGFSCPECGSRDFWESSRGRYVCCRCEYQQSLTAGTIMHSTKKPLTIKMDELFLAKAYIMAKPFRIEYPGAFYHVTNRGNAGGDAFKSLRDREGFLD